MAEESRASVSKGGEAAEKPGANKNIDVSFSAVNTQADDMVREFNTLMDEVSAKLNAIARDVAELESKLSLPAVGSDAK